MRLWARPSIMLLAIGAPLILAGCFGRNRQWHSHPGPTPLPVSAPVFEEVAAKSGLQYAWTIPGKRPLNILQTIGNGCAFLDFDNDGCLDILFVGTKLALYRGDGKGNFTDVTTKVGLDRITGHMLGCTVGDYDNDGNEDLYVSGYRTGYLLHNEAGKRFRDVTAMAGLKPQPWGTSCAFVDIDNDGRLDLFIGNYVTFGPNVQPQLCNFGGVLGSCGPRYYKPEFGVLYHNLGAGRFEQITAREGLLSVSGKALGVACADFNDTGKQSIAIANDEMPGDLLVRKGSRFENMATSAGVAHDADGKVHGGMGMDWGDFNNDGRLDLAVATFQYEPKAIYRNDGNSLFTEASASLGVAEVTTPYIAFGCKWIDYDNDGWLDLVLANGHVQDNVQQLDHSQTYRQPTQLLHNSQGTRFQDVSASACSALMKRIVGRGLAIGDYDNDGKMDVLVVDSEGAPLLLHNVSLPGSHWLTVRLIGRKSNRDGIGALLTLASAGRTWLQRCATDGSYLSASDKRVHFGLGEASDPLTLTVRWPSGTRQTVPAVLPDREITIREGDRR